MAVMLPRRGPRWIDLPGGVRVRLRPVWRMHFDAASAAANDVARRIASDERLFADLGLTEDDIPRPPQVARDAAAALLEDDEWAGAPGQAYRLGAVLVGAMLFDRLDDWTGLTDGQTGKPLPLTLSAWSRYLQCTVNGVWVAQEFLRLAAETVALEIDEGNVSAAGPDGCSDPAAKPAPSAAPVESPAPPAD